MKQKPAKGHRLFLADMSGMDQWEPNENGVGTDVWAAVRDEMDDQMRMHRGGTGGGCDVKCESRRGGGRRWSRCDEECVERIVARRLTTRWDTRGGRLFVGEDVFTDLVDSEKRGV